MNKSQTWSYAPTVDGSGAQENAEVDKPSHPPHIASLTDPSISYMAAIDKKLDGYQFNIDEVCNARVLTTHGRTEPHDKCLKFGILIPHLAIPSLGPTFPILFLCSTTSQWPQDPPTTLSSPSSIAAATFTSWIQLVNMSGSALISSLLRVTYTCLSINSST